MLSSIKPPMNKRPSPKVDMMDYLDSQDYSNNSDVWNAMSFHLAAMYLKKLYQEEPVRQSRIDEVETNFAQALRKHMLLNSDLDQDVVNEMSNTDTIRALSKELVMSGTFDRPF